ncbi:ankyrin repeat domain-containing protein, partial [Rhodoferax sp. OV413]|uniref:ankyrin repeat domain-containing protein n=1 Tax=Rhodoferax sp. OV413 TaxID=1855285 RepID=UPI00344D13C5
MRLSRRVVSAALLLVFALPGQAGSYEDFFTAIEKDDVAVLQQLLARGFDPNTINPKGVPALMVAIRVPAPKSVQLLLRQRGIKVEARNPQDESALMLAAFVGNLELCRQLIGLDADVNKPGWAPLHYAATNSHTAVMQFLLDNFAYIDAASPNATTPLMMAAMYGNASGVKLLLEAGADPTLKNDKDLSATDFARQAGKLESEQI